MASVLFFIGAIVAAIATGAIIGIIVYWLISRMSNARQKAGVNRADLKKPVVDEISIKEAVLDEENKDRKFREFERLRNDSLARKSRGIGGDRNRLPDLTGIPGPSPSELSNSKRVERDKPTTRGVTKKRRRKIALRDDNE